MDRVLFYHLPVHYFVQHFLVLSLLAEGMQLNPADQGLYYIFPTLSNRSNGSWDDHLLFFLSTKLLGVGLKFVERTDEGQMKYPLCPVRFIDLMGASSRENGACYVVGNILLVWFGSTCPLSGMCPCKSVQSCNDSTPNYRA